MARLFHSLYDSDEEHMFYMNKMLKTEEGTQEYLQAFGQYDDVWDYVDMIGKERIDKISATETAFLMVRIDSGLRRMLKSRNSWKGGKTMEYTRQEMMAIATGREFKDGELAILA
jgi:selenocysteine lyase/cysteine desulfurase